MDNPIIILTGPTASGKTAMSFDLAKKYNCEIICADSMTVYRGMDIGTDKPTILIKKSKGNSQNISGGYLINGLWHYLLDILNPDEEFNISIFKQEVKKLVAEIQARGKVPMLVGGSLLYIDSFVYDYGIPNVEPDQKLREELEPVSSDVLYDRLVKLDPDAEWTVNKHNRRRVIRALEVCLKTGQPFTAQKSKNELPKNILYLSVDKERELLYEKISRRVDEMMDEGFLDEVQSLYKKYDHSTALQATGYRQLIQYIEGEVTYDEAVSKTKQSHRNFAKRQLTWLRRNPDVNWVKTGADADKIITKFLIT